MHYTSNLWFFRYRFAILGAAIMLIILGIIPFFWVQVDSDLKNYFPNEMDALKNTKRIEESFGTTEPVLLLLCSDNVLKKTTLKRFSTICSEIEEQEWADKVISVFNSKNIHSEGGMMLVDEAIPFYPENKAELDQLTSLIDNNPLISGFLVSENHRYMLAMVSKKPNSDDKQINESISNILKANPGTDDILVAGEPQLRAVINKDIKKDLVILLPLGILLMLLFLWASFKNIRAVFIPIFIVCISIILSVGLMPVLGWKLSIISILIPVMMLAIANNYGIHFVSAYREELSERQHDDKKVLVQSVFRRLKYPVLLTGLTTIAGILTMVTHVMIPARQTGIIAGWGITAALVFSMFLVPVLLVLADKKHFAPQSKKERPTNTPLVLDKMSRWVTKSPKLIIVGGAIVMIASGYGISRLAVDPNSENVLPAKHEFLQANTLINENFGGSKNFSVMIEGDIKDPALLRKIDSIGTTLKSLPEVGNVISIATVIKTMSTALYDTGDSLCGKIPDTREAVAQILELYAMGGDPSDFEQIVDFNYEKTVMSVQFKANSNADYKNVFSTLDSLISDIDTPVIYGGYALITYEMIDAIIRGQTYSLALSVVIVFVLLLWIFRSWRYALLGCVPLSATILIMFGMMGVFGFSIDVISAMISSIVVGIGVDYTIHFLWRYRLEKQNGRNVRDAVYKTLTTTGKGIIINSLSVMIGFVVLLFSSFAALKSFSFLIITALLMCLFFSLLVVPALCIISSKEK
ncbi:MAG TPA: efflux RND transporter permease subunit [Bacteroidales bacterium]|nr:efflux RND transporter permease subunit [Bacteroidales bacterium]